VFENRQRLLPLHPVDPGYYKDMDVSPKTGSRGDLRMAVGKNGEAWYSPDHYQTFIPVP